MKTEKDKINLNDFCEFPFPTEDSWKETAEESLKGRPFETLTTKTYEGIELKPLYVRKDVENIPHINDLPGDHSFVRGTRYIKERASAWDIAQEITGKSPQAFNEALINDLQNGQTMVNLAVDEATKRGFDSDEANEEWVGLNGIPISSLADLEAALQNIDFKKIPLYMQTGISTLPLYAGLVALLEKQNSGIEDIEAYIGLDPIGTVAAAGNIQLGMKRLYNLMADLIIWSNEHTPAVKVVYVQGEVYHNAGASATEELAYALATGVEYISEMLSRGLEINQVSKHIYFSFAVGSNVFMEIAKLRAARLLWSKIIESFGGDQESQKMYIHARTSSWTKTVNDPYVNMLRTTTEAFAGAVGGADSMHVSPFDEAIRPADSFSRRIARNTQVILQEESYLNQVIDPAGGSWYVEALTDAVAKKAWEYFLQVEKSGGMFESLKSGKVQQQIAETAAKKKASVELRKDRIVGTNMYPNLDEKPLQERENIADFKSSRIEELKALKLENRDLKEKALGEIQLALHSGEQLVPLFIEAAVQGATIQEMIAVLARNCKGGHCAGTQIEKLTSYRRSEGFEQLRKAAEDYKQVHGSYPKIFFVNLGPISKHKARADFAAGFFAAGGFEAITNNGYDSSQDAISAVISSGLDTVIICGADDQYPEFVPVIAEGLKTKNQKMFIMVAGKPSPELEKQFRDAGVDEFIHIKSNCYHTLAQLQARKGVN
ncbi:acyl-CoA mutase large subunit family protein [Calidifontibacillus oryziterrae]|uniref:acyl-CoA mutase large subunit family protein n=1 Tax=Calidifontibacillus oryziterrae TaxID=1191699 RepID=UPI0002E9F3C4|nr:acyl-CoA mutase large subunit family protein [Calidifontibacillus oryziterrae]